MLRTLCLSKAIAHYSELCLKRAAHQSIAEPSFGEREVPLKAHRKCLSSNSPNTEHCYCTGQPSLSPLGPASKKWYYDEQQEACMYSKLTAVVANMKACMETVAMCFYREEKHQLKSKSGTKIICETEA